MSKEYIRKAHEQVQLTKEQILDIAKCMKRPDGIFHFTNFVDIDTAQGPKRLSSVIKPFQFDMLNLMQNNDRSILLASRQMSKCVVGNTKVQVLINNKEKEMTINEIFELAKGDKL